MLQKIKLVLIVLLDLKSNNIKPIKLGDKIKFAKKDGFDYWIATRKLKTEGAFEWTKSTRIAF